MMDPADEKTVETNQPITEEKKRESFSPKPFESSKLQLQTTDPVDATVVDIPNDAVKNVGSTKVKEYMLRKFFATRTGNFDHAVEDIKQYIKPLVDGTFHSAWLLAEIDHWDHEKERVVILTNTHIMLIHYNFVAQRIEECKRIQLHMIDKIQGGQFEYPEKSMQMARADQTGIRISWNKNEVLSRWQRFSPFFNSPSYITLTLHKAGFHLDSVPPFMIYEDFKKALIDLVQASGAVFEVVAAPLFLEVYVGAVSTLHNSSDLGYSKDRGRVSF